jgi:protein involved in polysaccharide export with SLBB domain
MLRKTISLILITICISVNGQNLENKIVSEGQLNEFWSRAKGLGYDLPKVLKMFQEGGFTYSEALSLVERIKNKENSTSGDPLSIIENDSDHILTAYEKSIFGLKLFSNTEFDLSGHNTVPTPKNYQLGVGDKLQVVLYGETDFTYKLTIDKEGRVAIPYLGPITLSGLNIDAAKSLLKQKLSQLHSGLKSDPQTSFIDMTLTDAKSVVVNILGEVKKAGVYAIPSTASVFNALFMAGGPTITGTLRKIKIYRASKLLKEVDLYDFIMKGNDNSFISLTDQDVIIVETYRRRIEIRGEVKRPGLYEISETDKIVDLINFAGGLKPTAEKNKLVVQREDGNEKFIKPISTELDINEIFDGDILFVPKADNFSIAQSIEISGSVNKPGFYEWVPNLNLAQLIDRAGGVRSDAASRVSLYTIENGLTPTLNTVFENFDDIVINKRTLVYVSSYLDLESQLALEIEGSVNKPGVFPFYKGMTLLDIIALADGLQDRAIKGKIEIGRYNYDSDKVEFSSFSIPDSINKFADVVLRPRDHIIVRPNFNLQVSRITVRGDVGYPGEYQIDPLSSRISEVIDRFGGFTPTSNLDGVILMRRVQNQNQKDNETLGYDKLKSLSKFIKDPTYTNSLPSVITEKINEDFFELENIRLHTESSGQNEKMGNEQIDLGSKDSLNYKLLKEVSVGDKTYNFLEMKISMREIMNNSASYYNIGLVNGDILYVPSVYSMVEIDGAVYNPTQVLFESGRKFKEYIAQSGGAIKRSNLKKSYVQYSNGNVKKTKSFLYLNFYPREIKPDSRIFVPNAEKLSVTEDLQRVISFLTTTLTTYVLINSLVNN